MSKAEKFCLEWNDFKDTVLTSLQKMSETEEFLDVTLITEDNNHIKAHRLLLSACSPIFQNILKNIESPNPYIYLRGISTSHMLSIVEFIYKGKVNVYQDDLENFLAVAEDLKLKGLSKSSTSTEVTVLEQTPKKIKTLLVKDIKELKNKEPQRQDDSKLNSVLNVESPFPNERQLLIEVNQTKPKIKEESEYNFKNDSDYNSQPKIKKESDNKTKPNFKNDARHNQKLKPKESSDETKTIPPQAKQKVVSTEFLDTTIEAMMEKTDKSWTCIKCGKVMANKAFLKRHIEGKHIEGVSHLCPKCGKCYRSRNSLSCHISQHHKEKTVLEPEALSIESRPKSDAELENTDNFTMDNSCLQLEEC